MRNFIFLLALLFSIKVLSQSPPGIPYQAIARATTGEPYANGALQTRFTLHEQTATGTVSYAETHNLQTDAFGLFSTTFGAGAPVTGTFAAINWGLTTKYLQVEIDLGNGWIDMGTQQLMSVPYAMYAGSSGSTSFNQGNSNFNPSIDSVLTLYSAGTIIPGTYVVPPNEYWKILSFYTTSGYGSVELLKNLELCSYVAGAYRCYYRTPPYPLFTLDGVQYLASFPNDGNFVITASSCSECASSLTNTTSFQFNFPIPTPFWLAPTQNFTMLDPNVRLMVEKYK